MVQGKTPLFKTLKLFDSHFDLTHHLGMDIQPVGQISTEWIEALALEELNMDESGVVHFNDHLNPAHYLEESSIRLMDQLRDLFEIYVNKFNEYRGPAKGGAQIKIFKISNTINDFMLFRNSLRLVFARKANDMIGIGFLSNGKDLFSPRLPEMGTAGRLHEGASTGHELRAHLGPFNKVSWRFQGEPADLEPMVRFYLSEFIRNSAR